MVLQAVDGFIDGEVDEGGVFVYVPSFNGRQGGIVELFAAVRRQSDFGIGQAAHLFVGDAAPVARYHCVGGREAMRQVHGNHVELRGRAALQEQDFVVGRNVQQRAQVLFGVMEDAEEHFRAVAHRHDGEACAVVVEHFLLRGTQYGFGQDGGTCGKVVDGAGGHGNAFLFR